MPSVVRHPRRAARDAGRRAGLHGPGAVVLARTGQPAGQPRDAAGPGLRALLGTFCFSTGNMLSSLQQRNGIRPLTGNAYGMLYGAAILLAGCVATGQPFRFDTSTSYVGALLYLAIPGSVIGFTAYLTLVGRMGPARAAYARCCSRWWRCRSRPMRKAIGGQCRRCWGWPGDAGQSAGLHQVDALRAPGGGLRRLSPGAATGAARPAGGRSRPAWSGN